MNLTYESNPLSISLFIFGIIKVIRTIRLKRDDFICPFDHFNTVNHCFHVD